MNSRFVAAASAAIAFVCLPSVASAQDREPVTARVVTADLNLASDSGRATLQSRVRNAIRTACGTESHDLAVVTDQARCRREMEQDGRAQIASLLQQRDVEVAQAAKPLHIALAR